jgi:hypothetical protein
MISNIKESRDFYRLVAAGEYSLVTKTTVGGGGATVEQHVHNAKSSCCTEPGANNKVPTILRAAIETVCRINPFQYLLHRRPKEESRI